jgi:xanthine dehydrogenase accessory factor
VSVHAHAARLESEGTPFVLVTVVDAVGSVPQDQGARMIVTAEGLATGTVGGGKIEAKAMAEAQRMLSSNDLNDRLLFVDWNLKRDVGMTCGGSFKIFFEKHGGTRWDIAVFGAGHVAQALIPVLLQLDCRVTCFDMRAEWLSRLPDSPRLKRVHAPDLPAEVPNIPEGAFVLLMTMGHTSDRPILIEILRSRSFPYLGVIGSAAKAMRLQKDVTEAGLPEEARDAFYCPIGLPIGTNQPMEIAVSVAAQLIQERDQLRSESEES